MKSAGRIVFLILLLYAYVSKSQKLNFPLLPPPARLRFPKYFTRFINRYIIEMTEELVKDAHIKLMQTRSIQVTYRGSLPYELGTVAASIEGNYKRMLKLYRHYSNMSSFTLPEEDSGYHSYEKILNALFIVQGEYNKIRLERDLYIAVKEKHLKARAETKAMMKQKMGAPVGSVKDDHYRPGNKFKPTRPPRTLKPDRRHLEKINSTPAPIKYKNLFNPGSEVDVARKYANKDIKFKISDADMSTDTDIMISDIHKGGRRSMQTDNTRPIDMQNADMETAAIRTDMRTADMETAAIRTDMRTADMHSDYRQPITRYRNPLLGRADTDISRLDGYQGMRRFNRRSTKKPLWRAKVD